MTTVTIPQCPKHRHASQECYEAVPHLISHTDEPPAAYLALMTLMLHESDQGCTFALVQGLYN